MRNSHGEIGSNDAVAHGNVEGGGQLPMRGASFPLVKAWGVAADASRRRGAERESGLCIHATSMIRGTLPAFSRGLHLTRCSDRLNAREGEKGRLETFSRPLLAPLLRLYLYLHFAFRLDSAIKTHVGSMYNKSN